MSVLDQFRLDGKVAIVTGGSRGLGKVIANALAEAGASVVLTARTLEPAEASAREITASKTLGLAVDVTRADDVSAMIARTQEAFGRVDILVNMRGSISVVRSKPWPKPIGTRSSTPI